MADFTYIPIPLALMISESQDESGNYIDSDLTQTISYIIQSECFTDIALFIDIPKSRRGDITGILSDPVFNKFLKAMPLNYTLTVSRSSDGYRLYHFDFNNRESLDLKVYYAMDKFFNYMQNNNILVFSDAQETYKDTNNNNWLCPTTIAASIATSNCSNIFTFYDENEIRNYTNQMIPYKAHNTGEECGCYGLFYFGGQIYDSFSIERTPDRRFLMRVGSTELQENDIIYGLDVKVNDDYFDNKINKMADLCGAGKALQSASGQPPISESINDFDETYQLIGQHFNFSQSLTRFPRIMGSGTFYLPKFTNNFIHTLIENGIRGDHYYHFAEERESNINNYTFLNYNFKDNACETVIIKEPSISSGFKPELFNNIEENDDMRYKINYKIYQKHNENFGIFYHINNPIERFSNVLDIILRQQFVNCRYPEYPTSDQRYINTKRGEENSIIGVFDRVHIDDPQQPEVTLNFVYNEINPIGKITNNLNTIVSNREENCTLRINFAGYPSIDLETGESYTPTSDEHILTITLDCNSRDPDYYNGTIEISPPAN